MLLRGGLLDGNLDEWIPLQHQLEQHGIHLHLDLI